MVQTKDSLGAQIFNGYIVAHAAFAAWELGIFRVMENDNLLNLSGFVNAHNISPILATNICNTLAASGILSNNGGDSYYLTDEGKYFLENIGYLTWAVGGYGEPLSQLHELAKGSKVYGRDIRRNDFYVAKGTGEAGKEFVLPHVYKTIKDIQVNRVVDIGCGSASFLISLCQEYPDLTAVGIDISYEACGLAEENIRQTGLEKRIEIICESFEDSVTGQTLGLDWSKVDLVTSFFMFHDLMNGDNLPRKLQQLRANLASNAHLLILDTMKASEIALNQLPIFSLGFELNHAIMGVKIWPIEDYDRVFEDAGLKTIKYLPLGVPSSWLYLLS